MFLPSLRLMVRLIEANAKIWD